MRFPAHLRSWANPLAKLLLAGLCLYAHAGFAQQFRFSHLSADDGLSHNSILDIAQDRNGFIWIATRDGLNRYDGNHCKVYRTTHRDGSNIGVYTALAAGSNGEVYVGASHGLYRYDYTLDSLRSFDFATLDRRTITERIKSIRTATNGWLYVLCAGNLLYQWKPDTQELIRFDFSPLGTPENEKIELGTLFADSRERVWIGADRGRLYQFETQSGKLREHRIPTPASRNDGILAIGGNDKALYLGMKFSQLIRFDIQTKACTPIELQRNTPCQIHDLVVADNTVYVGTENGLYIHDDIEKKTVNIKKDPFDPHSLSDNSIYALYRDSNDGIWIGTYFAGVHYLSTQMQQFMAAYYPLANRNSISGNVVREIIGDGAGNLWIGTEDAGLNYLNTATGQIRHYGTQQGLRYTNIHGLALMGHDLYAGVYSIGLDRIDLRTRQVSHYAAPSGQPHAPGSIYSICRDRSDSLWIGTDRGIYRFLPGEKRFAAVAGLENIFAHQLMVDCGNNLWIASVSRGFLCLRPGGGVQDFTDVIRKKTGVAVKTGLSLYEDSRKRIWLSTMGDGLFCFDPATGQIIHLSEQSGLPNNVVHRPVEDNAGYIWFGTNRGLVRYAPDEQTFIVFTTRNGLPTNQFNFNSSYRAEDGRLYFGTVSGLVVINPDALPERTQEPPVYITEIFVNNEPQRPAGRFLEQSPMMTRALKLPYHANSVNFQLSILSFSEPWPDQYELRLDGYEKEWDPVAENGQASFRNIPPGDYTLQLRFVPDRENIRELFRLSVSPPWWRSAWAYAAYALCLLMAVSGSAYLITNNIKRKRQLFIRRLEYEKGLETQQFKTLFFTNITHEIRTPLSLIKVPLEYILKREKFEPHVQKILETIDKNTNRLITLTEQFLDFRKAESSSLKPRYEQANINLLLGDILQRFQDTLRIKHIELHAKLPEAPVMATVDIEMFTKIISNLFNNAVKYGDSFIEVSLDTYDEMLQVQIKNDGELIPADMQDKIFEPFMKLATYKKGLSRSGLGLTLARSLAELHGGRLVFVPSGDLNVFQVILPLQQHAPPAPDIQHAPETGATALQDNEEEDCILLVEDNEEMLSFLKDCLGYHYRILTAANGLQAIDLLNMHLKVDLIISDIMMPEMNGIELLKTVRQDVAHSHIPFMLLTAKTDYSSKMEGLENWTDAYVEKPFSYEHLLVQIHNLLSRRTRLKEQFARQPFADKEELELSATDRDFIRRIDAVIEANLKNPQFGIDSLASAVNLSRSSMHRKIKGLLNLTPNDYVKLYRLKQAASLLQQPHCRINEVAEQTGFTSPSYFTKCFLFQFGVTPRQYQKTNKK